MLLSPYSSIAAAAATVGGQRATCVIPACFDRSAAIEQPQIDRSLPRPLVYTTTKRRPRPGRGPLFRSFGEWKKADIHVVTYHRQRSQRLRPFASLRMLLNKFLLSWATKLSGIQPRHHISCHLKMSKPSPTGYRKQQSNLGQDSRIASTEMDELTRRREGGREGRRRTTERPEIRFQLGA